MMKTKETRLTWTCRCVRMLAFGCCNLLIISKKISQQFFHRNILSHETLKLLLLKNCKSAGQSLALDNVY